MAVRLETSVTRVNVAAVYRNGSISWDSVPLWKERRSMVGEMPTDEVDRLRIPEGDDETPLLSAPSSRNKWFP